MRSPRSAAEYGALEIGTKEATGRNDGDPWRLYMPHSYGRADGDGDGELDIGLPWCAGFVLEMYRRAGRRLERNARERWAFCKVSAMWFALVRRGWQTLDPYEADIVFIADRGGSDAGKGSHVALVEKCLDGVLYTIEGNLGDAVRRFRRPVDAGDILGFIAVP